MLKIYRFIIENFIKAQNKSDFLKKWSKFHKNNIL